MPLRRYQLPAYSPVSATSLRSGLRSALGRDSRREVAETLQEKYAPRALVLTDTGTSALRLAIESARQVRPGHVALPAYSCYDVWSAAEGSGAEVLLYDLDPMTLGPEAESLEEAIRRGATVIVVVHLYGVPVDMGALDALRRQHGVIIIEDAAQAIGSTYDRTVAGALGELSVLSFARGKGVTGGGGGALLAHSPEIAPVVDEAARAVGGGGAGWRHLARATAVWLLARPSLYSIAASMPFLRLGETVYRPPADAGGMSRATLGILKETIRISELEAEVRKKNAAELLEHVEPHPGELSPIGVPAGADPGYLRVPILATDAWTNAELASARPLGIMRGYPQPLADLPSCRQRCGNASVAFPGAKRLATGLVTLPTHSRLRPRDKRAIGTWLRDVAASRGGQ